MTHSTNTTDAALVDALHGVVKRHWGFDTLRPLQIEAMTAARQGRDALVIMPTGGGKSLCYQAPALLAAKPTVVVSPLIALMKDQVDRLLERDIPAAFYNTSLDATDKRRVTDGIARQAYKLIFVAPERFADENFWRLLDKAGIGAFAIDEAHCISHWGHDFRGDYRRLDQLKLRFPQASVHAFTATATPHVRKDIAEQLKLVDPAILVGDFFRPNLIYRVQRRHDAFEDVYGEIEPRRGQAGIVYCIRRRDVDDLTGYLRSRAIRATSYHAGMSDDARTKAQDAFAAAKTDVIVATVAFGMGIDRADIRFVIHAAMPKSIEHYQQETGRAGRDGQPADCVLFFNGGDFHTWKSIIDGNEPIHREALTGMLSEMYRFASGMTCRHRKLVTYFGQEWKRTSCGACDVCNDSVEVMADSTVTAQKIMSAVVRTGQRYGAAYVCDVLTGSGSEKIIERGHDQQSTYGLMREEDKSTLMAWIDQLADQGMLEREGEYRVIKVTPAGWRVLRSQEEARLRPVTSGGGPRKGRTKQRSGPNGEPESPARRRGTAAPVTNDATAAPSPRQQNIGPLDMDEKDLFEKLRTLRRTIADEMNTPAFVVFSDKTLREIARAKPTNESAMLAVKGVGPAKFDAYGEMFLKVIREHLHVPE